MLTSPFAILQKYMDDSDASRDKREYILTSCDIMTDIGEIANKNTAIAAVLLFKIVFARK